MLRVICFSVFFLASMASFAGEQCTGSASGCNGLGQVNCGSQRGCYWDAFHFTFDPFGNRIQNPICKGRPDSCSSFPPSGCSDQMGCYTVYYPSIDDVVGEFKIDGNSEPLYSSEPNNIGFSQNLDTDTRENMTWSNPGNYITRFEYRVDFGTSGKSQGGVDSSWIHYDTYSASVKSGRILFKAPPITTSTVPLHYYKSDSRFYDPNDYAKLYYRMRFEDSSGLASDWRYLPPIWVYYND